jgi:DNA-binding NarL/FixJ family response regulator
MVTDGYRVSTIARELGLAASTVRNHLSAIFQKLGVGSQGELVERLARAAGRG